MNALKPLDSGNVLIVGAKASFFNDEIKTNPRVIIWDSQNEHWNTKDLPHNVRAVFITRFVGHTLVARIIKEAKKKRVTLFNTQGTGMIARQVTELLSVIPTVQHPPVIVNNTPLPVPESIPTPEITIEVTENEVNKKKPVYNKLKPLAPYVDATKTINANAKILMERAKEMGIESTEASLGYFARNELLKIRGKLGKGNRAPRVKVESVKQEVDVSIQVLDETIKGLNDVRQYLIEVTKENQKLKAKLNKVKEWFNE